MRWAAICILIFLSLFAGFQVYKFSEEKKRLAADFGNVNSEFKKIEMENKNLKEDTNYFSDSNNVMKELRSKFNLKHPDEKMMIIVPQR